MKYVSKFFRGERLQSLISKSRIHVIRQSVWVLDEMLASALSVVPHVVEFEPRAGNCATENSLRHVKSIDAFSEILPNSI